MKEMSPEDRSGAKSKTFEAESLASSILGLPRKVKSYSLEICRGMGKEVPANVTQRKVLSQVSSVFDPYWLFSVFTVRFRLLLKGIWKKQGQSWDECLSQVDEMIFKFWPMELSQMKVMAIRRKYISKNAQVFRLACFRWCLSGNQVHRSSLLTSTD